MNLREQIFTVVRKVAYRTIGDQVVIVDPAENKIMTLNETGSAIWGLLDGRTVGEVALGIEEQFEVPGDKALSDVIQFLEKMADKGLVVPVSDERPNG